MTRCFRRSDRMAMLTFVFVVALSVGSTSTQAETLTISGILAWFAGPSIGAGAETFLESHPNVDLSFVGAGPDDVIVRIVGGSPPDLVGLPPSFLAQWAQQGLIQPLTPFVTRDGVNPADFIPPVWQSMQYRGDVWAMPLIVDPNFALVYNKRLFLEAGLNPESPPKTIDELDEMFSRLLKYGHEGEMTQFPIVPWNVYGSPNTALTWGWAFGGEFVNTETGAVTAHHPKNVEALQWVDGYFQQHGADANDLMARNNAPDDPLPLFINELSAMFPTHSGGAGEIAATRPDIDLGIATMPHQPEGGPSPTWIGGWTLAIPTGAPNPELSWELAKALTATPEGTDAFATHAGWFTGYIPSPSWEGFMDDPVMGPYVDIVLQARHAPPTLVAYQYFDSQLEDAVLDLLERREFSAREVLERVSRRTEEETVRILESPVPSP